MTMTEQLARRAAKEDHADGEMAWPSYVWIVRAVLTEAAAIPGFSIAAALAEPPPDATP